METGIEFLKKEKETEPPRGGVSLSPENGFTFLELMLTLAIVMIVTSVASLAVQHSRERARLAVFYSDIRQTKFACQTFELDLGFYPLDVWRDVDPGLVEKFGWKNGGHSSTWETVEKQGRLDLWNGPYLNEWKRNPWGGLYDFDNYPPGYDYMGITGGAVYLTLKPSEWGGTHGMPTPKYEDLLEETGVDISPWSYCVSVFLGRYPEWNNLPSH